MALFVSSALNLLRGGIMYVGDHARHLNLDNGGGGSGNGGGCWGF